MVEEQLIRGNALPNPGLDRLSAVVRCVPIEVTAESILPTSARGHGDPHVEVVRPAHNLQVNSKGKIHVHNMLVQVALGIVYELPLRIIAEMDAMLVVIQRGGKGLQDRLAVHRNLPPM